MSVRQLPFLLGRVFNTPLLVTVAKLDGFLAALPALLTRAEPNFHVALMEQEQEQEQAAMQRPRGYSITNRVATLPIHGALVRRGGQMDTSSTPLQSYEGIQRTLRSALRDSRVGGIMLDVDSPGGEAGMVMDLANEIRQSAQTKPIWASANDDAFSAGYALASAAQRLWTTRTGGVGSIGVVALHTDQSAYDQRKGFNYDYVFSGARKVDCNPHSALSGEGRARVQNEVNRLQDIFASTVALHRGMRPEQVKATEAGVYFGEEAIFSGLADQIGTAEEAHAALASHVAASSRRRVSAMSETTQPGDQPASPPPTPPPADPPPAPPPPPVDPAQAPQPAAQGESAEIISLSARTSEREYGLEVMSLCNLARMPELAHEYIAAGLTRQQVSARLQTIQAEKSRSQPAITPIDTGIPPATPKPITSIEAMRRIYG